LAPEARVVDARIRARRQRTRHGAQNRSSPKSLRRGTDGRVTETARSRRRRDEPERAIEASRRRAKVLAIHAALFILVNGFMVATWLMSRIDPPSQGRRPPDAFWPGWLMMTWGFLLGVHAIYVWARRVPRDVAALAKSGRVVATVLFTDIVGSTRRAAELGDRRWGELLNRHDQHAKRLVHRFGGRIVKTLGDGLLAVFEVPRDAILCAQALRDDLMADGIEIRAGLHTGEVELRGYDIGGIGVHIASRIMAAAGTGEILTSRTVRDLVSGSEIVFADRGSHALKGVQGDWQLFAVHRVG
jgi:class 3 adenylate cyclase